MELRHQEYIDYYKLRLKKYEGNPLYPNTYASEKALYDAIAGAADLNEFKARLEAGNLANKNANALVKDQETARLKHYREINEPIRAKEPERILEVIDSFTQVMDMITATNEIRQKVSLEVSVDGFVDQFYADFLVLENLEVERKADVPSSWKGEIEENIRETIADGRELYNETTLPRAREWQADWKLDHEQVWEDRHRRVIPVKDETIRRRIAEHKAYLGL